MKVKFDASGDVLVITGGANGICRALAIASSRAGASVSILDIDVENGEALAREHDGIEFHEVDVSDRDQVFQIINDIEQRHGKVDGLVCGAAIQPRLDAYDTDPALWQKIMDVNVNGVMWIYQAVVKGMKERKRGSIIAFSSGLSLTGWPKAAGYASTKGALNAFVKSVAKEVAESRVKFNLIAPGVIDTPQYRAANEGNDNDHWKDNLGVGGPEDVVGPLMFLLSDAASMTSGTLSRDFAYPLSPENSIDDFIN